MCIDSLTLIYNLLQLADELRLAMEHYTVNPNLNPNLLQLANELRLAEEQQREEEESERARGRWNVALKKGSRMMRLQRHVNATSMVRRAPLNPYQNRILRNFRPKWDPEGPVGMTLRPRP